MRLTDPSSDLAVALAIASSYMDLPMPATAVAIGEVGLAGDLRRVTGMDRRLAEAARLGLHLRRGARGRDGGACGATDDSGGQHRRGVAGAAGDQQG